MALFRAYTPTHSRPLVLSSIYYLTTVKDRIISYKVYDLGDKNSFATATSGAAPLTVCRKISESCLVAMRRIFMRG